MDPQNFRLDVSASRTKLEPDSQYCERERKEPLTRTTFLSGEDTQLRVERRKGRKSAMVRNLVSWL